jgi:hypothetical protein
MIAVTGVIVDDKDAGEQVVSEDYVHDQDAGIDALRRGKLLAKRKDE